MRPSAPSDLVGYVDTLIGIYSQVAANADITVLEQQAAALQQAANVLGTACHIT
jgi:hypothetical protein